MPKRTVLTVTTMMELKAISTQEEKPVTIVENVETPISFMYLFQNLMVQLWNCFLPLPFPSFPCSSMFPVTFTRTFEFIAPTSILEPAITPTFKQFYPPPIFTKHPIWYSLDANFFIVLWGILYGLHWQYFQNSPLCQKLVAHGEKQIIRLIPQHPIPFDILKNNLFNHFLILLYHGNIKLNHSMRDDWINLKQLCMDWYFLGQTAIIFVTFDTGNYHKCNECLSYLSQLNR